MEYGACKTTARVRIPVPALTEFADVNNIMLKNTMLKIHLQIRACARL